MTGNQVASEKRIMGIDYGEKRIGLALSDPLLTFAYPFKTLDNDSKFWIEFLKIIDEESVKKIILGHPSARYGSSKSLNLKVTLFKNELERKLNVEVILWDETYTSSIAAEKIIESVPKKKNRRDKGLIDRNSAAIILQEYLNTL